MPAYMDDFAKGTLTAASGYQQYNALNTPVYAKGFIKRFYADSIIGSITSQDIFPADLRQCGDQVVFKREPVGEIFEYVKNQDLSVSSLNSETVTMIIGRAKYTNLKLDRVDEKRTCDIKTFVQKFMDNSVQQLREKIDHEFLTEVPLKASPYNKGLRAGLRTGQYNLGQAGRPVVLTKDNFLTRLTFLQAVLDEQNLPSSERYLVLPYVAKTVLQANGLLNDASASGLSKAILLSQQWIDLAGFKVYFSNNMPQYTDPTTGQKTYLLLAGIKQAAGFITQLTQTEIIDQDPRSFSKYWRSLNIYDFGVFQPEMLAVMYATFEIPE